MAKTENGLGKFGVNFDDSIYKGPLTVGRPAVNLAPKSATPLWRSRTIR